VSGAIRIRQEIVAAICAHARETPRAECCGLLASRDGVITRAFPATNAARDPATSYEIAPEELFRLMRGIRGAELTFAGIYHSHPNGVNEPSARDVAQAFYPDTAYFIVSPRAEMSKAAAPNGIRAFSICEGKVEELQLEIL
jgi:proteasome lid subunit RPN8/RPN11